MATCKPKEWFKNWVVHPVVDGGPSYSVKSEPGSCHEPHKKLDGVRTQ